MLETVDLSLNLPKAEYQAELLRCQLELRELGWWLYQEKRSLVLVFEGWDAAGKGGAIRRLTEPIDPRGFEVFSIAAPAGEDKTHHYLWRFWRRLLPPQEKQILIFDRSWYGRVLVERVEGFAATEAWKRAYREINDFERQLQEAGFLIAKLWFQVSPEEQLRRFEARKRTPHKTWKLTDEDWRNRDQWEAYRDAVEDMLLKTSTLHSPWTVVEGDDKYWARVKALRTVAEVISAERGLAEEDGRGRKLPSDSKRKKSGTMRRKSKKR